MFQHRISFHLPTHHVSICNGRGEHGVRREGSVNFGPITDSSGTECVIPTELLVGTSDDDITGQLVELPYWLPKRMSTGTPGMSKNAEESKSEISGCDFRDPQAIVNLATAELRRDYGISIKLDPSRLCPRVPNRAAYIRYMRRILETTLCREAERPKPPLLGGFYNLTETPLVGIDVGTGHSAIYPLIACSLLPKLRMFGTDIDAEAVVLARENVARNPQLRDRIRIVQKTAEQNSYNLGEENPTRIDFTLCNPPFYSDAAEISALEAAKQTQKHSVLSAKSSELITPGGEVQFVLKLIADSSASVSNSAPTTWFSCLIGKRSSLPVIARAITDAHITNFVIDKLPAPGRTTRWIVAWSFAAFHPQYRPPQWLKLGTVQPPATVRTVQTALKAEEALVAVREALEALEAFDAAVDETTGGLWLKSPRGNVWARRFRRKFRAEESSAKKRKTEKAEDISEKMTEEKRDETPQTKLEKPPESFECHIIAEPQEAQFQPQESQTQPHLPTLVTLHWVYGADMAVFESFGTWIVRHISSVDSVKAAAGNLAE